MEAGEQTSQSRADALRRRAEELRTRAEGMKFAVSQRVMLHMADTFDKLANRIEGKWGPAN